MKQIKRNSHSFNLLTILLLAVLCSAVSNAALITVGNASFEEVGASLGGAWYALPASGDWVDGNGGSAYEIYDTTISPTHFSTAADGNRVLNLQPATPMKQDLTIPVTINDIISMTFYVGDSFAKAPAFISTAFTLDGVNASPTSQVSNTTGDGTWQQKTVQWTATSAGNLGISFASGDGGWIDNVSVDYTFVPPSTINLDLNSTNSANISLESGDNVFDFAATNGGSGLDADYLIVAGGGNGGSTRAAMNGGGGGAGGLLEGTGKTLTGAEAIVVGKGGALLTYTEMTTGGTQNNGEDSSAFGLTAVGGGAGGTWGALDGRDGGSGGGGASGGSKGIGTAGPPRQGYDGVSDGGVGGGAGGTGSGKTGGIGVPSSITGTSVEYAAGGGISADGDKTNGDSASANTGSGGEGADGGGSTGTYRKGGAGGSGIVVVRYAGPQLLIGGTPSTVGGDTVHTFTNVGESTLGFNATIDGDISGDGNMIWNGGGTLTLNGTNIYTGTTTIDSGSTLQIGSGGTTGTLGTGAVTNNGALVFNRSGTATITNDVSGTGSVEHAGSGTLELTGTLSYDGPTSVTGGGILEVASGSFGDLSVGNGTLSIDGSGIGEIDLGANSLTLNNGAIIDWQFTDSTEGNYDQIVSTAGDLLGSGTITIHVSGFGDYSVSKGDRFKLYDGNVSEGAFGNFAFVFSGDNYQYWTMERNSLDIVSTIPEPSTAILAGLGLAGMCLRRRRG